MSHSHEQKRKKEEAIKEALHHKNNMNVAGENSKSNPNVDEKMDNCQPMKGM